MRPSILTKMSPHASIVHCHFFFSSKNEQIRKNAIYLYIFGEKSGGIHFFFKNTIVNLKKILGKREILAEKSRLLVYIFRGKVKKHSWIWGRIRGLGGRVSAKGLLHDEK